MTIAWNPILHARAGEPVLRNMAVSGGRSATGREQRVMSSAGYWEIPIRNIVVNTAEKAAAYRAMMGRLRQGEDIVLPIWDMYGAPGGRMSVGFREFGAGAEVGATQVTLTTSGIQLAAGQYFSYGSRLYLITEIVSGPTPRLLNQAALDQPWADDVQWADGVSGFDNHVVKITPPIRSSTIVYTQIRFTALSLLCVLKDFAEGDLDLDLGRFATPSLTFVESI